ncbi:MAG: prepilin-type N-terminal cleavage/methylation domain-containing protein [Deltaproteobacteria bacterium]|nr:prepilin-type N-terminal cleavage/methylation domain-containing protein [Deltaproteobacteria bacterium]
MRRRIAGSAGFTLIEIMISLSILSISLLSIYAAQGNSLRASGRAENIQTASMLARQKMTEKMIELQKDLDKGKFPDEQINDQGEFEPPFDRFRWEFAVRKVEIPVVQAPGQEGGEATGAGPATSEGKEPGAGSQAPAAAQENLAKMVTKKISESVREITTKVIWQELEEDQTLVVTTHIAKLQ